VEVAGVACDERDQVPGTRQSRHVARSLQDGDGILRDARIERLAGEESDTGAGHASAPLQPLVTDGQGDSDRLVEVEACCTVRAEKQLGFTERRRRFSPGTVAPQPCDRPAEQVDCGGRVTAIERG